MEASDNPWYRERMCEGLVERMAAKMVKDVRDGFSAREHFAAHAPRKAADPTCKLCRGRGGKSMRVRGSLSSEWVPCPCMEKETG